MKRLILLTAIAAVLATSALSGEKPQRTAEKWQRYIINGQSYFTYSETDSLYREPADSIAISYKLPNAPHIQLLLWHDDAHTVTWERVE